MYKTVTSTQLKQNTRKVIQMVRNNPSEPAIVYSHKEPQVVVISYEEWQKMKPPRQPRFADIKKYSVSSSKPVDSAAIIRKWRDEE